MSTTVKSESGHSVFTTTTWADLGNRGLCRDTTRDMGWMQLHDLSVEAYEAYKEHTSLTFEDWRALVSAVASGLPVELVVEHVRRDDWSGRMETSRTTAMFMVDQITGLPGRFGPGYNTSVRRWGFATTYTLRDVKSVHVPDAQYDFDLHTTPA